MTVHNHGSLQIQQNNHKTSNTEASIPSGSIDIDEKALCDCCQKRICLILYTSANHRPGLGHWPGKRSRSGGCLHRWYKTKEISNEWKAYERMEMRSPSSHSRCRPWSAKQSQDKLENLSKIVLSNPGGDSTRTAKFSFALQMDPNRRQVRHAQPLDRVNIIFKRNRQRVAHNRSKRRRLGGGSSAGGKSAKRKDRRKLMHASAKSHDRREHTSGNDSKSWVVISRGNNSYVE